MHSRVRAARVVRSLLVASSPLAIFACSSAQTDPKPREAAHSTNEVRTPVKHPSNDMRGMVERYEADRDALERFHWIESSPHRTERLRAWQVDERAELERVDFDALDREGKVDWILL